MSDPGPAVPTGTIGAADLRVLVEGNAPGLWVLDTRTRAEYEAGHVPGALHCEVHELSKREKELPPRGSTVVVVGGEGARGRAGAVFLVLAGYGGVRLLEGGFAAWTGAVEAGAGRPLSAAHPPKPKGWTDPPIGSGR